MKSDITREQAAALNTLIGSTLPDTLYSIECLLGYMNAMLANIGDPSANGEQAALACYSINDLVRAALAYEREHA